MQYNRFNVKSLLRGEAVILQKRYRKGMRFLFLAEPFDLLVRLFLRSCACAMSLVRLKNRTPTKLNRTTPTRTVNSQFPSGIKLPAALHPPRQGGQSPDRRCCCKQKIPVLHTGT